MKDFDGAIILLVLTMIGLFLLIAPVNTAGVVILHNGTPIHNLAVSASYQGSNGPFMTGTTDGTGTFIVHTNLVNSGMTVLYNFNINGTGYSFAGSATQMTTVSL